MKKPTKPISSPGRRTTTEKFAPPLMKFLRSNVGSKSSNRGRRSRASPMFFRKKNTVFETTQEPSSPKVTCIGQVRVRRSKKNKKTTTTTTVRRRRRPSNRLCPCFRKLKPKSFFSVLSKWVSFFRCGYCKKPKNLNDSPVIEGTSRTESINAAAGNNGEQETDNVNRGLILRSPPRNALLLTRCRSAPYRSSSLASKLWESTMEKTGEEEIAEKVEDLRIKKEEEKVIGNENGGLEINEEDKCIESNEGEELKASKVAPLMLTRCKSEPARTWDQLLIV